MRLLITLIFISAFSFTALAQIKVTGRVTNVVDGKTITIETSANSRFTVELQFIEVPKAGQPFADVVKEHLRKLTLGKTVTFRTSGLSQESRLVGQVWLNDVDLSEQMLRDGAARYANVSNDSQNLKQREIYLQTENAAKTEKRGVWAVDEAAPEKKPEIEKQVPKTSSVTDTSKFANPLKQVQKLENETDAAKTVDSQKYKPKSLKSLSSPQEFIEECYERSKNFDLAVTECYSDKAEVAYNIYYPNGTTRTLELSGVQVKKLIAEAMPVAKQLNDYNTLSNVTYTAKGKRFQISATRYSERKKYYSPIYFLVGRDASGAWKIYEEISESQP
jgi:endonuclease YncB( thermonuclease family)